MKQVAGFKPQHKISYMYDLNSEQVLHTFSNYIHIQTSPTPSNF